MADNTSSRPGGDIHRLLDEAFFGVEMTPDTQDLKEEVRANLMARVADLEASGMSAVGCRPPGDRRARRCARTRRRSRRTPVEPGAATSTRDPAGTRTRPTDRLSVRPKPAFVVRIVVASIVAAAALVDRRTRRDRRARGPAGRHHPGARHRSDSHRLDRRRLARPGDHDEPPDAAAAAAPATPSRPSSRSTASASAPSSPSTLVPLWGIVIAAVGVVAGIVLFSFLGATQTNRHKAWLRQVQRESTVGNRFEEDPESAARFGIYTAVIWVVAFAAFIVLSFTIGWLWSWLALLGGFVVMMLVLARMLFAPRKTCLNEDGAGGGHMA